MNYKPALFKSFFQGGFECSSHRKADGNRLDLIESTLHDKHAYQDYLNLASYNIKTVRDGIRWHLIEHIPGYYNWSSFLPMLYAARKTNTQVIWDLCHYGWPDDIDIWSPKFINRFADFARAVAALVKNETDEIPIYSPINEISFWAWAGGDRAYFNPTTVERGLELKIQLVRATLAAIDAIREVEPRARFVQAEPLINVLSITDDGVQQAAMANNAQYQTWDMIAGKQFPGLGGQKSMLDIIGVNYYSDNQWFLDGPRILRGHPNYVPFSKLLERAYLRYKRPIFIAETGSEGNQRVDWFKYICDEVFCAINLGNLIEGICLYPITDYPGWDDFRNCETGLLSSITGNGKRNIYQPLASEILHQQKRFNCFMETYRNFHFNSGENLKLNTLV